MINNGTTDNCTVASLSLDNSSFTCSNLGANTVTLTATDESGNKNSATATVTVKTLLNLLLLPGTLPLILVNAEPQASRLQKLTMGLMTIVPLQA